MGEEIFASGDEGEMCAVYREVHVSMIGNIEEGGRSARVRLWDGENVIT